VDQLPFDEYVRSLDRKRTAAGVLLRDTADRVLFVRPSYRPPGRLLVLDLQRWAGCPKASASSSTAAW
jgi:hypothetical protein